MNKPCNLCGEASLEVGEKTDYGSIIVHSVGDVNNGWFATLSPKTGGDPEKDFSIQIMPKKHLRFFSEIHEDEELAKNYGIVFAKLNHAIAEVIKEQKEDSGKMPVGTYGKCKHEDEHIHFKLFPYKREIGQPFTVDSSFEKKEVHKGDNGEEFVKLQPVRKKSLRQERLEELSKKFISILNQ